MTDYPERINVSPVHRQKREDDFYLVDREAFPNKGVEYTRTDVANARIEELEAKLAKAVDQLQKIATFGRCEFHEVRATLAKIKGETDDR